MYTEHDDDALIDFEWDPAKAAMNIRKHGISFEIATRAFDDAFALTEEDRVVETEQRWKTIALAPDTAIVVVIYTYPDEDVVRISARKANRKELRLYAKQTHQ